MNFGIEVIRVARALAVAAALILLKRGTASAQSPHTLETRALETRGWGLGSLMFALHQVRASTARFVETRHVHLLNQPQTSSGRLIYVAPNRLQKVTIEPIPERLTIDGERLTFERQGEPTRDISLRAHPEIGALAESVRATLAGDLPALTRYFTVELVGDVNGWLLTLTPKEAKPRDMVAAIRIKGQGIEIRDVETTEADGDRTDTVVSPDSK
jgi:outer membrane lipoprotein-sorting protein